MQDDVSRTITDVAFDVAQPMAVVLAFMGIAAAVIVAVKVAA